MNKNSVRNSPIPSAPFSAADVGIQLVASTGGIDRRLVPINRQHRLLTQLLLLELGVVVQRFRIRLGQHLTGGTVHNGSLSIGQLLQSIRYTQLLHQFVLHIGEHLDVHLADGVHRGFSTASALDGILHLADHKRVGEHHHLSAENLRFLLTDPLADVLCHPLGLFAKGLHRLF